MARTAALPSSAPSKRGGFGLEGSATGVHLQPVICLRHRPSFLFPFRTKLIQADEEAALVSEITWEAFPIRAGTCCGQTALVIWETEAEEVELS